MNQTKEKYLLAKHFEVPTILVFTEVSFTLMNLSEQLSPVLVRDTIRKEETWQMWRL